MTWDIFEEAPFRGNFLDDAGDLGPEVARVVLPAPLAAQGEGLARITGRDEMNLSAPRSAVKGSQIVPDKSRIQGRVRHPRHESGRGETVAFDITQGAISGFCEMQAKIEASDTGAKADAEKVVILVGGTKSHTRQPFLRGRCRCGLGLLGLMGKRRCHGQGSAQFDTSSSARMPAASLAVRLIV